MLPAKHLHQTCNGAGLRAEIGSYPAREAKELTELLQCPQLS